jgi:hypothetical protein
VCDSGFRPSIAGASVLSAQPVAIVVASHPGHATQQNMLSEQSLLGTSTNISAHGERPLWEFGPKKVAGPLGDIARAYRKDKEVTKKSAIVVEN